MFVRCHLIYDIEKEAFHSHTCPAFGGLALQIFWTIIIKTLGRFVVWLLLFALFAPVHQFGNHIILTNIQTNKYIVGAVIYAVKSFVAIVMQWHKVFNISTHKWDRYIYIHGFRDESKYGE